MTRTELGATLNLTTEFIPEGRPNRPGSPINIQKITIHNTSNTAKGADAKAHSKFVRTKGHNTINDRNFWVSWHYTVDDEVVIKQLPISERAFHARRAGNDVSIGIEVCMHEGIDQEKANDRTARLAAILCYDLSLDISNVVTHKHWTGKNCPVLLLKEWDAFIEKVELYLDEISEPEYVIEKGLGADAEAASLLFDQCCIDITEEEEQA